MSKVTAEVTEEAAASRWIHCDRPDRGHWRHSGRDAVCWSCLCRDHVCHVAGSLLLLPVPRSVQTGVTDRCHRQVSQTGVTDRCHTAHTSMHVFTNTLTQIFTPGKQSLCSTEQLDRSKATREFLFFALLFCGWFLVRISSQEAWGPYFNISTHTTHTLFSAIHHCFVGV